MKKNMISDRQSGTGVRTYRTICPRFQEAREEERTLSEILVREREDACRIKCKQRPRISKTTEEEWGVEGAEGAEDIVEAGEKEERKEHT